MATSKQMLGLLQSHVEGDDERFFTIAGQMADGAEHRGHTRLAEQLRDWVDVGRKPNTSGRQLSAIARPLGDLSSIIEKSQPTDRIVDLVLADTIIAELNLLITEYRNRAPLEEKGLRPHQRILLTGPPGTGKTMSASALAGTLRWPLYSVHLHGLISRFMGDAAGKLKAIFDAIRNQRGVYLFDEIGALAVARASGTGGREASLLLNSFLQFLDKTVSPSIVVATTNRPEILDPAVLHRFDLVLAYEPPDAEAIRTAMARQLLLFEADDVEWSSVLYEAKGLSTCDVILAAEDAARRAALSSTTNISTASLVEAISRRKQTNC